MKAVLLNSFGSYNALKIDSVVKPVPGPSEVLVRVKASSISNFDVNFRKGKGGVFQKNKKLPEKSSMGLEFSGIIEELGSEAKHFAVGDKVYGMVDLWKGDKSHAEFLIIPEKQIFYVPEDFSFVEAASMPIAVLTSIRALIDLGKLKAGQKVLINGASGGVGVYAVQIAKALKAEVYALCSSSKVQLLKKISADHVYDYEHFDLSKFKEQEFDVIFDVAAKWKLSEVRKIMKEGGSYISSNPVKDMMGILLLSAFSSRKSKYLMVNRGDLKDLARANKFVKEHDIKPIYDSVYEFEDIKGAHQAFDNRKNLGKVIIQLN